MIRVRVTLRVRASKFCWVNIEACNVSGHFMLKPSQYSTNVGVVAGEKKLGSHMSDVPGFIYSVWWEGQWGQHLDARPLQMC